MSLQKLAQALKHQPGRHDQHTHASGEGSGESVDAIAEKHGFKKMGSSKYLKSGTGMQMARVTVQDVGGESLFNVEIEAGGRSPAFQQQVLDASKAFKLADEKLH
jgi:hypothetical protein